MWRADRRPPPSTTRANTASRASTHMSLSLGQDTGPRRITGRRLQQRRRQAWARNPYCASCGRLTDITGALAPFELDHITAMVNGGSDTVDNLQVLCIECHEAKTRRDLGRKDRPRIGLDGWPVEE